MASGILNVIQYNYTGNLRKQLSVFESTFGTYDKVTELRQQQNDIKDKNEHTIIVYIKVEIAESQIVAFKSLLERQVGVSSVQYVSSDQELNDFKSQHKNHPVVTQSLNELGSNPLPATLTIKITDPLQKQSLINFIKANDTGSIVENINF